MAKCVDWVGSDLGSGSDRVNRIVGEIGRESKQVRINQVVGKLGRVDLYFSHDFF